MWERVRRALLNSLSAAFLRVWKWVRAFWCKNGLLTLSMLSVATGCLLGFLLRALELTELVSLAGTGTMGMGARGMEWGSQGTQQDITIKGPKRAQPQKQKLLAQPLPPHLSGPVSPNGFSLFFLTKKLPTNAKAAGQILPPSTGSEGLQAQIPWDCRSLQVGWGWERGEWMLGCWMLSNRLPPTRRVAPVLEG